MAEDPNIKAVGHDAAKSLVTVAVAVLGLSATFLTSLDGAEGSLGVFTLAWIGLVVTALLGSLATGSIMKGLKEHTTTRAGLYLNLGLGALVVSSALLAFGAYRVLDQRDAPLEDARTEAIQSVKAMHPEARGVRVVRLDQGPDRISLVLRDAGGARYTVVLRRDPLEVARVS